MGLRAGRPSLTALALVHATLYAFVVTGVVTAAALLVSAASGGGLVRTKVLLFGAGWILMAYAVVRLWPSSPEDLKTHRNETLESGYGAEKKQLSLMERLIIENTPISWLPAPPPGTRVDERVKLFLVSVLVLSVSFLLETVFGAT